MEALPYRAYWRDNPEWLLADEYPNIESYQSHSLRVRRTEDVNGVWELVAYGFDAVLWTADWTEMAFYRREMVTWQTFPDARPIGCWNTSPFWTYPVAWSPDGRFLVTEGNVPGQWEYGLFVLKREE